MTPADAPEGLPPELRAFLYSCIDSVEQIEILALLRRSDRPWTTRAVGAELSLADRLARHHLEILVARGLLQTNVGNEVSYRYDPKSAKLRRYGDELAEYYTTSRLVVLRELASAPRRSIKSFADAFQLREPE